jgi:hypothetical protein
MKMHLAVERGAEDLLVFKAINSLNITDRIVLNS